MASILIVEDDLDGGNAMAGILNKLGHRAICVPNGREALAMLAGAKPDLILLDVRMPEMDGATFLQVLRSYLRWQDIPVIIVTALPAGPELDRAVRLGVREVLRKGTFTYDDLPAVISRSLPDLPPPARPLPGSA